MDLDKLIPLKLGFLLYEMRDGRERPGTWNVMIGSNCQLWL